MSKLIEVIIDQFRDLEAVMRRQSYVTHAIVPCGVHAVVELAQVNEAECRLHLLIDELDERCSRPALSPEPTVARSHSMNHGGHLCNGGTPANGGQWGALNDEKFLSAGSRQRLVRF